MTVSPRMALLAINGSVVYLGLAILGWGGFAPFFSHPALATVAIIIVVLTVVALFTVGNLNSGEREDRANRWIFAALAPIGLLLGWLPAYTDRMDFWTLDGDTVRWLGVVLVAAGGALRLWPVFVLGPSIQRTGRHPAWAHAGHNRHLWRHPSPELSRTSARLAGLGANIPVVAWRAADGADDGADHRPHSRGGVLAELAVRCRIRCLP